MKKCKIILVAVALCISAYLGTFVSTLNVDAANNECSENYTETTYINNLSYTINGNTVTYSGAQGLLYATNFDATQYPADENGNFSFTIPDEYMTGRIEVYFYLAEDDGVCETGKEIGNNTFYIDSTGRNQLYDNALCVNYRNKWSNNETMKNAVPYCFTETVSVQYSYNEVSGWISEAERLYEIRDGGLDIEASEGYTNVDNVKNTDKLTCDAFSTNNYETMHKYSHKGKPTTINNCTTTCVEEIEVNFSDPVATQAGMCFQYLIEIKSKVKCDSVYTAPKPSKKAVCYLKPYCISSNGYENTHGGPTEDFDACVQECDGGEYSQSCIDSCYTEVYENGKTYSTESVARQTTFDTIDNTSILTFNTYTSNGAINATQIADGCLTDEHISWGWYTAQEVYNFKQRYPGGSFVNGTWKSGGTCPSKIGYYYFSTLSRTQETINELTGNYHDQWAQKQYSWDENGSGILKRIKQNDVNSTCRDTCYWTNAYSCGSNTVLTEYLAEQEYQKELAKWEAAKNACENGNSTCLGGTADYKIVVDNLDTNDDKNDENNKSEWQEEFKSSQKLNGTSITGAFPDMVTLATGYCENGTDVNGGDWHYHNIITFPGTWINNKTGQAVHSIEPGNEDFYTYVGNEYCTKLNSVPVNTAWWYWKVVQNGDNSVLTDSQKQEILDATEMNIRGSIDNYGYFGWNFDVECFYAVDDSTCDPNDPDCCDPDDPDCNGGGETCPPTDPNWPDCEPDTDDEIIVNKYKFRPVSLDTLFPSGGASNTSVDSKDIQASNLINDVETFRNSGTSLEPVASATRAPGFNWTCAATNLENPDYIIQPVSLINDIQYLGNSIYEGDKYLDYHVILTPTTMNKVRAYNSKYDSYTEPSADNSSEVSYADPKTPGITVYRSYLLHEVLDSNELVKEGLIGCNNQKDGNTCDNTIDTNNSCYNEYMAQSAVLKGGK